MVGSFRFLFLLYHTVGAEVWYNDSENQINEEPIKIHLFKSVARIIFGGCLIVNIQYIDSTWPPTNGSYLNTIVLYKDGWNDYGYKTTFHMVFLDSNGEVVPIGTIKIYYWDYDLARDEKDYLKTVSSLLDSNILQLDKKYCSLGQGLKFYSNIKENCPDDYMDILSRLNDLATNQELQAVFLNQHGVQTSLLRESSAEKALQEAEELLNTDKLKENDISFSYQSRVPYMDGIKTLLNFDFRKNQYLPYRVNALVGKNGTGKTQVLTNLAEHLSGLVSDKEAFPKGRPPFYKVISISYSAFDSFKVKRWENSANNGEFADDTSIVENLYENRDMQSYVYCGIQTEEGTLSLESLRKNFQKAFTRICDKNRIDSWKIIMSEVMESEHVKLVEKILRGESDDINWSSGQHILVCTLTEVLANIESESIILFDEPEIHLHPNAVANTMRMLNRMLEEYNSYAIIATHSPLIIQEIPSNYIQILERENNILTVRRPVIECFGENITQITNEIFDVKSSESNYRSYLRKDLNILSFEEVLELFDGKLSFNALLYLKACIKVKSGDNVG